MSTENKENAISEILQKVPEVSLEKKENISLSQIYQKLLQIEILLQDSDDEEEIQNELSQNIPSSIPFTRTSKTPIFHQPRYEYNPSRRQRRVPF